MDAKEERPADQHLTLRRRGPFAIDSFQFKVTYHPATHVLDCLNQIHSLGMPLSHVTLSRVSHDQLDNRTLQDFLVHQLTPSSGSQGLRTLTVDHIGLDADDIRTFCTTIAHSQSLQEFPFVQNSLFSQNPTHVGTDVWWPWLAYAVFSRDTTHHIHKVCLNVETLTEENTETMRGVLEHNDSLGSLYTQGTQEDLFPQAMMAALAPATFSRQSRHEGTEEEHKVDTQRMQIQEPGVSYQVLRNRLDKEYIEVLVPGTGVGLVERREVLELRPLDRRPRHPVRELPIEYLEDDSVPGFLSLIPLVGEPLERLALKGFEGTMFPDVIQAIRQSCKNLKCLEIELSFMGPTGFNMLFATDWPLESLSVIRGILHSDANWSNFFAF